jgi:hypothetical protein
MMCDRNETDKLSTGRKFTKAEVDYKKSSEPEKHRCGICQFYLRVPGTDHMECSIVEGPIKDADGCKLFTIDLIEAALHPCPKKS